jgi:hypothetical protein
MRAQLRSALSAVGVIQPGDSEPVMLLWGAPVPRADTRAQSLQQELAATATRIGEHATKRTEPDVILDFGPDGVLLIEVKHRSGNEVNPGGNWGRYVCDECFDDIELAQQSSLYELVRNWRVAWEIAGSRPFALVNLGPARLFGRDSLSTFTRSLGAPGRGRFLALSWEDFASVPPIREDEMLPSFLSDRHVGLLVPQQ